MKKKEFYKKGKKICILLNIDCSEIKCDDCIFYNKGSCMRGILREQIEYIINREENRYPHCGHKNKRGLIKK